MFLKPKSSRVFFLRYKELMFFGLVDALILGPEKVIKILRDI